MVLVYEGVGIQHQLVASSSPHGKGQRRLKKEVPTPVQGVDEGLPRTLSQGPSTQCLRTLVPKAISLIAFGTRVLSYLVLGPSG